MKYYKLKISLDKYEDRLNRIVLFKHNCDLDDLAFTILSVFNTLAYHLYVIEDDVDKYECEISYKEAKAMNYPDIGKPTTNVTIDMLQIKNNRFKMVYDFGENYEFIIEVLEEVQLDEIYRIPKVIGGKGYGIVEDGKYFFEEYLNGNDLDYPLLFIKKGRKTEVNFDSFDLEECNRKLKREISKIRNAYKMDDLD